MENRCVLSGFAIDQVASATEIVFFAHFLSAIGCFSAVSARNFCLKGDLQELGLRLLPGDRKVVRAVETMGWSFTLRNGAKCFCGRVFSSLRP